MDTVKAQIALQLFDKMIINKGQLLEIIQVEVEKTTVKKIINNLWKEEIGSNEIQVLMQLNDKQVISDKFLIDKILNIEYDEKLGKEKEDIDGRFINGAYKNNVKVKVKKLDPKAIIPKYQREGDAGFDFHALIDNDLGYVMVEPKSQMIIRTGISCTIPEGHEIQVRPRSGLAYKYQITVTNSPGTIDCVAKGTKIMTPAGEIKVEELYKNKEVCVYSFNEDNREIEEDIVEDMWIVEDLELLEIETEEGSIKIPKGKEVYTREGWKIAKDLTNNDEILHF
jgi:deoxyuridine 5'-triphosphate nucleotidohydrolase